ncbi:MAG: hypothetical protein JXA53_02115, partial [Bacteroidales bacterium]|nr:hypothetical protein [Bacteroidales bacterium]
MIDKLYKKKFWLGQNVLGIKIILDSSGILSSNIVHVKKNRSEIEIEESWSFKKLEISKDVKRTYPCSVVIIGSGIVHKKAKIGENINDHFPDFNSSQFYIQKLPFEGGYMISLIRKKRMDEIIEQLQQSGFAIAGVSLGSLPVAHFAPLFKNNHQSVIVDGFMFSIANGVISNIDRSNQEQSKVNINDTYFDAEIISPYIVALSYFIKGGQCGFSDWQDNNKEVFYRRIIKLTGIVVLSLFFTMLLANYFVFDSYSNKLAQMEKTFQFNQSSLREFNSLKKDLEYKKSLFDRFYSVRDRDFSLFADRIFANVPDGIILTEWWMSAQEDSKRKKRNETAEYLYGTVKISGEAKTDQDFDLFVKKLNNNKYIKKVAIVEFSQPSNNKNGLFIIRVN